jgi:hypothetical protein
MKPKAARTIRVAGRTWCKLGKCYCGGCWQSGRLTVHRWGKAKGWTWCDGACAGKKNAREGGGFRTYRAAMLDASRARKLTR